MTLKQILTNPTFKSEFRGIALYSLIIYILFTIVGYSFNIISTSARIVYKSGASSQILAISAPNIILLFISMCFLNILVSMLLIFVPKFLLNGGIYYKWFTPKSYSYLWLGFQFMIFGNITGLALHTSNVLHVMASLLPHGIIEIPVAFAATAFGISRLTIEYSVKEMCYFILFVIALLISAGFIEVFITPMVMIWI